ncbi:hypothetical protein SY88_15530 [Clostridiales bacterium PH28_bin88]|nr:hypothetical protein SY88_15530 [Clostridiales bacterium PH28_bin88]
MDLKEVIVARRSIRMFKPDPISEVVIIELLEAARLAPSGTNRQPSRFFVVKDAAARQKLQEAAFGQRHVGEAPVVMVCCADMRTYTADATKHRLTQLLKEGDPEEEQKVSLPERIKDPDYSGDPKHFKPQAMLNVAIAIEHLVLMATSLGLGTCWVQRFQPKKVVETLNLPDHLVVVALVPLGYPARYPKPRPRLALEEIYLGSI